MTTEPTPGDTEAAAAAQAAVDAQRAKSMRLAEFVSSCDETDLAELRRVLGAPPPPPPRPPHMSQRELLQSVLACVAMLGAFTLQGYILVVAYSGNDAADPPSVPSWVTGVVMAIVGFLFGAQATKK